MNEHRKYPSTKQFRNIVDSINFIVPEYDKKPIITAKGTVKVHGSNCGIRIYPDGTIVPQSRNNILTLSHDHFSFARFVHDRKDYFSFIFKDVKLDTYDSIMVYGDLAEKGIQKGAGLKTEDKVFIIFDVKLLKAGVEYDIKLPVICNRLYNVYSSTFFKTFEVDIDFNDPGKSLEEMMVLVHEVEAECPVAKGLGLDNQISEGIVFKFECGSDTFKFKLKGERHSKSKVTSAKNKIIKTDPLLEKFAVTLIPDHRLIQMKGEMVEHGVEYTKEFINLVKQDIIKEEMDLILKSGFVVGIVLKSAVTMARDWWIESLKEF